MNIYLALLTIVSAATPDSMPRMDGSRGSGRTNLHRRVKKPAFSFASTPGQGMGSACACAAPTGSRGETLSVARAGSAYCAKNGLAATGIANGDLVMCGTNQARVMPGVRNGPLGLLREKTATNYVLQSQSFDSAAWVKYTGGTAPAVPTADTIVAPDGSTTAESIVFQAVTGGQYSIMYQETACLNNPSTLSLYAKSAAGSGTQQLGVFLGLAGGFVQPLVCEINEDTWTRCSVTANTVGGVGSVGIGNSNDTGTNNNTVVSAYVWGVQCEKTGYPTSYIPTVAAAVARASEAYTFNSVPAVANTAPLSISSSIVPLWISPSAMRASGAFVSVPAVSFSEATIVSMMWAEDASHTTCYSNGKTADRAPAAIFNHWWCSFPAAGDVSGRSDASLSVVTSGAPVGAAAVGVAIGSWASGLATDAVIYDVCVDPNPERCR